MSRARDTANQINRVNSSAADATAITVDSSENVGIGTSSPDDKLHVNGSGAFIRVNRTDGESGITLIYNGSNSTRSNIATQTNGDLRFDTASSERMRILSGGGLTFNGDTAAANALDDYEEGTFTPTVVTGTLSDAGGAYTKIGNTVIAYMYMGGFSDRGSGNVVTINNLPFTSVNSTADGAGGSIFSRYCNKIPNATYNTNNSTNVSMYESSTGNYDTVKHADLNSVSAYFFIQVIYKTN